MYAVSTFTVENCGAGFYHAVKVLGSCLVDLFDILHIQVEIQNPSAACAEKMIVRHDITIKSVTAVWCGNLDRFANISQQIQIPVYGTQADVGEFFLYMQLDRIGSGVILRHHQIPLDGFTLPTILQSCQYRPPFNLYINNSNCYCD